MGDMKRGETGPATLGARIRRRERAVFVGRETELARFDQMLAGDPPGGVLLLHGPGGIGKSALLRELERRGAEAGWKPHLIDGRQVPPLPEALADALAGAAADERPLVLIDSYERLQATDAYLRGELLPSFSERTVVVIAGRRPPDRGWWEAGWHDVAVELELGPLSAETSRVLLEARGLGNDERMGEILSWAGGSPLALHLAAYTAGLDRSWRPRAEAELAKPLLRRLAESGLHPAFHEALAVASIARVTTVGMLRDVLPEMDPEEGFEWLQTRTFVEPLGAGLALHELVRRAVRADLRRHEPDRERELRRRIADHLHARAVAGEHLLTSDLADLIDSRVIRSGYGPSTGDRYRIDGVRPLDAERVAELLAAHGRRGWWEATVRFFAQAPERVAIACDPEDEVCGYSISVTPSTAPAAAREDALLGPWLEHAETQAPDGNAVIWRDSEDFSDDPDARVRAMVNMAGVLRSGLKNPRWAYLPIDPGDTATLAFSAALGGRRLPELDVELGSERRECHLVDYGPGGLLGAQRDVVYTELGLVRPPSPAGVAAPPVDFETVRNALRNLHVPSELARSPLAREIGAEGARELIEEAAERAFGDSDAEKLLQRVLVQGYIEPGPSHEAVADRLNLSRSSYFRRLKQATERVASYLGGAG